jgi:uncharacterized protein YbjT (DUF2867 family)
MENKSALLAGATGLTGQELLHFLLESSNYESVKILVRKYIDVQHPKLEQVLVDFNRLGNYEEHLNVHDVYCCLGTTIKNAGSEEAFRKVDYEYPLKLAELSKQHGVNNFLVISALGANADSKVFYSRTKGELERDLKSLQLPALHIFQPSLLLGDRSEFRFGEKLASILSPLYGPLMVGRLKKYKPVRARRVAYAMYVIGQTNLAGPFTYPSDQIREIRNQSLEK